MGDMAVPETDTAVVIPAKDEAERIGATVTAALKLPGVDLVVVVDDGSSDETGRVARAAGARVVRHSRNRGKAAAMESGAEAVRLLDEDRPRHLLFLDADLGETAAAALPLITPVRAGEADLAIATFATRVKLGGHGIVVRLARDGIKRLTGWEATQPLNGQRCLTRAAFEAARPLAYGFGVETGMTIDLLRKGFRVVEVEVEMAHRATGTDWRSQLHRAKQLRDVGLALAAREPVVRRARAALRPPRP
ncbi:MAG: glycosyltransferase [Microbispora sp.]|nr:glycosyltransferase [Microbispora sp.]